MTPAITPQPDMDEIPEDEKVLAHLGLHPLQVAIAQHIASGGAHQPMQGDGSREARPEDQQEQPAIARPQSGPRPINVPSAPDEASLPATSTPMSSAPQMSPVQPMAPTHRTELEARQQQLDKGSGIAQFQQRHPVIGGITRVAAGIGSALFPGISAQIPGTDMHHQQLENENATELKNLDESEQSQAQTKSAPVDDAYKTAQTAKTEEETKALQNPQPADKTPEEDVYRKLSTQLNPDTQKPYTPLEAFQAVKQAAEKPIKAQPAHVTYDSGIPVSVVGQDGKVFDVNDPKLPPELKPLVDAANRAHGQHVTEDTNKAAASQSASESRQANTENFQEKEKGREHIQKIEGDYHDASEKADTLRGVVQAAKNGNMVAGSLQPLLAVLGVTTMEGVKRINNTELQNVTGAGSLMDNIRGKIGKLTEGQPMDAELQKNITDLADLLQKSAYKKYSDNHASTKKRYKLDDEQPIAAPQSAGDSGGKQAPAVGTVEGGYKFKGGNPADQKNWEKTQ